MRPSRRSVPSRASRNRSRSTATASTSCRRSRGCFSYRIDAANPGRLEIPSTSVSQGSKHATAQGASLDSTAVPTTDDMRLDLQLPSRPVFVGETIEAQLVWLFRSQPEDWTFTLPMAQLDELTVSAPPIADRRKAIEVASATKTLDLPYTSDETEINGQKWGRVTIKMFVAPRVAGHVAIPATSVSAGLAVGQRDFFGNADTQLFRANDVARTLDVKPLPETDKPAGLRRRRRHEFSISVGTSRSVVQLGEPLELAITVKAAERLDALALPKLDGPGMLPEDKFSVPAEAPTGELSDDGKTKTFNVTAQIDRRRPARSRRSRSRTSIRIKGTYETVHSEPIALSVAGSRGRRRERRRVRDAEEGWARRPPATRPTSRSSRPTSRCPRRAHELAAARRRAAVAARRVCSTPCRSRSSPCAPGSCGPQSQRDEAAEVRAARQEARGRARIAPRRIRRARRAGPLAAAMRALARVTGPSPMREAARTHRDRELRARCRRARRCPPTCSRRVREETDRAPAHKRPAEPRPRSCCSASTLAAPRARATRSPTAARHISRRCRDPRRDQAQGRVRARRDAARRRRADAAPDKPELLADWGNAALGAGDVGVATLAYRRALAIDPSNARAQRNLAWLREPRARRAEAGRIRRRRRHAAVLPRLAALAPAARRRARVRDRRAARRAVASAAPPRPRDARDPARHRVDRDAASRSSPRIATPTTRS